MFVSLLLVQLVGFLLEMAFLSHRWLRILYAGASIGLIALFLLPTTLIIPMVLKHPAIFPEGLNPSLHLPVLPSTLAANALVHIHEGDISYVFRVSLPFLGVYLIASGYLAYRLAVKIHLGGAQAGGRRIGLRKSSLLERTENIVEKLCFFLPPEAKALLVKDLVYLMRWNALKVSYPVFVVILFVYPWSNQDAPFFFFCGRMFLFVLYLVNSFSLNAFGMDGAAVHHCFIAPTSGRDIIVVKNCTQLVHAGAFLIAFAISLLVGRGHKPTYPQYLSSIAFSIGGILILHMLGGKVSILHPMTIQIRKVWGRTSSGSLFHALIAGFTAFAYVAGAASLCSGYFWKDQNMVLALAWGFVGVVSILYIRSSSPMGKFLENHKEHLLMSLQNETRLFIRRSGS